MNETVERVAVHVWVSGRVQGVAYRASTVREAQRLGVKGWVRNLPDGRVEGHFEGTAAAVQQLLQWCKEGPPLARVDDVQKEDTTVLGATEFHIR